MQKLTPEILDKEVMRIIREVGDIKTQIKIKPEHKLKDGLMFDSLDTIDLAVKLEDLLKQHTHRKFEIPGEEIERWKLVKDVTSYIGNCAEQNGLYS